MRYTYLHTYSHTPSIHTVFYIYTIHHIQRYILPTDKGERGQRGRAEGGVRGQPQQATLGQEKEGVCVLYYCISHMSYMCIVYCMNNGVLMCIYIIKLTIYTRPYMRCIPSLYYLYMVYMLYV